MENHRKLSIIQQLLTLGTPKRSRIPSQSMYPITKRPANATILSNALFGQASVIGIQS